MNNQLTINELRAYQAGQLDGPARHRVERLLLEDPFYADALEGLEALQRKGASLPKQTAQLRQALHARIGESATERRLYPLWVTTMAASILLVLGVSFYFIYTNDPARKPVAHQPAPKTVEPIVVEIGPTDSALIKTVETVGVLETHVNQRQRLRETETEPVISVVQLAQRTPARIRHTAMASQENTVSEVVTESKPAQTKSESVASLESILAFNEPKVNPRRISHPERAFGPNAPEPPEVTFWNDDQSRLARLQTAYAYSESERSKTNSDGIVLNEVNVVGYGTQQKRAITGAVAMVPPAASPGQRRLPLPTRSNLVQGTIIDQQGVPLPGVSVLVKGTKTGTTTDGSGRFSFDSSQVIGHQLHVSFIGYVPQELPVAALEQGPVKLAEDNKSLSEVVVVGYGNDTRKRVERAFAKRRKTLALPTEKGESFFSKLNGQEADAFRDYLKRQASLSFHGPLSVRIQTDRKGNVRRVDVEESILVKELDGTEHRDHFASPAVRAEAERLVRGYDKWPKKRQWVHWILSW